MIIVEPTNRTQFKNQKQYKFYLIDGHHHLGEDTDGKKNIPRQSFEFFKSIWKNLQEKYSNISSSDLFSPQFKIVETQPSIPFNYLCQNYSNFNQSWIFDQFIAFPFHDTFRQKNEPTSSTPIYQISNTRIHNAVKDPSNGLRIVGYCRLDPHDGKLAIEELDRCITQLGIKGLKLHPLSDGWNKAEYFLDDDSWVRKIVYKAALYGIPIIFDCRYTATMDWIYQLTLKVRNDLLKNGLTETAVNQNFKIIIAHIGFLWQNDENFFKIISHPNIYGDLTGQFGNKTKELIDNLKYKTICPFNNRSSFFKDYYWTTKIFLGSDFNYFEAFHIVDQLLYFFSEDFYKFIEGNLFVLENIFSRNMMRLLPKSVPLKLQNKSTNIPLQNEKQPFWKLGLLTDNVGIASALNDIIRYFPDKPVGIRSDFIPDLFTEFSKYTEFYNSYFQHEISTIDKTQNIFFVEWSNTPLKIFGWRPPRSRELFISIVDPTDGTAEYEKYLVKNPPIMRYPLKIPDIIDYISTSLDKNRI
jgi:hypothetical protein